MSRSLGTLPVIVLLILASGSQSLAQSQEKSKPPGAPKAAPADQSKPNDQAPTQAGTEETPKEKVPAMPSLIEKLPDYSGDLAKRSLLLGDWGGIRTELADLMPQISEKREFKMPTLGGTCRADTVRDTSGDQMSPTNPYGLRYGFTLA